ncbi:MAG: hypothetical protein HY904_26465 [Deltaproteobacteria bacterium]|nr:hypothetical protein [Deltaproteobacteria bacterium]
MAVLGLLLLWPAPAAAQETPPAPAPAQAPADAARAVRVHIGAFGAATPSARSVAGDVALLAQKLARDRPGLRVTADPPQAWLNKDLLRHEGALLKCMNPWSTKPQVLACLDALPWPDLPPVTPPDATYLVEGTVTPSDAGQVVSMTLYPMLDGKTGPPMASRQYVLTGRVRRPQRDKALGRMMQELWDAAEGKVTRPPRRGGAP